MAMAGGASACGSTAGRVVACPQSPAPYGHPTPGAGALAVIGVSRLRATGTITPEMTTVMIQLGDVETTVDLSLLRFPNGGSWSFFRCPSCGQQARTLRLLCGDGLCKRCCVRRGVRHRCAQLECQVLITRASGVLVRALPTRQLLSDAHSRRHGSSL